MKLCYTPNSPYARICRVAAAVLGLSDRLELDWVTLRDPASPVVPLSPLGRIPLLVDGDLALPEARAICAYLDHKAGRPGRIVPAYGDWPAIATENQHLAFLDAVTVWSREVRRADEDRSDFMLEVEESRAHRYLAYLEETLGTPADPPEVDFGRLALVAGIGMMRFYDLAPDWRSRYPGVAAWSDAYDAIPVIAETAPSKDALRPLTR